MKKFLINFLRIIMCVPFGIGWVLTYPAIWLSDFLDELEDGEE